MPNLPEASVVIDESAGALAGASGYCVVMAPVALSADTTPRVFSSPKGILSLHGYSAGADYVAHHIQRTRKPVIFIGLPIATAGTIGSLDVSGVTGSSVITVTADTNGVLEEVDASLTVVNGGVIGTDQISFDLSLDGGETTVRVRLGTANTYTIPFVGLVLNFGAGNLVAEDFASFRSKAPMWNGAGITAARTALAAQQNLARSWMVIGDMGVSSLASAVVSEANNYETSNQRFTYARTQVTDLLPLAKKSKVAVETLTFAATGHTITRSAGDFLKDGFAIGQSVSITGTTSNNTTETITALSSTVMTFASGIANEGPINSNVVGIVSNETMAVWMAAQSAAFASIDADKRISIGAGRDRAPASPITGWAFRRPCQWDVSIRGYQHDVQIPTWRKSDGPLAGSLTDDNGNIVEFDERIDGGGLAGRFTCLRSYGNGPSGAFCALDLTRDTEGALLSRVHNLEVANLACTVVQAETENAIGLVLQLNPDGTGTDASLSQLEQKVNSALQRNLLQNFQEGPRCSSAVWSASRTALLNTVGADLPGVLALQLNGTLEQIDTTVKVS